MHVYAKPGKTIEKWEDWKGAAVQGEILRRATYLSPMIMINALKEGTGAVLLILLLKNCKIV